MVTSPAMTQAFADAHRAQFGFVYDDKPIVVEAIEVESVGGGSGIDEPDMDTIGTDPVAALHRRDLRGRLLA